MPSYDRGGRPFEITLELVRDGEPFGSVGERCGFHLARLARSVAAARADESPQAARWPDVDDRFPDPPLEQAAAALPAVAGRLPREPELFSFRYRDRGDLASTGELRCALRTSTFWAGGQTMTAAPHGGWRIARRAVVEAWGAGGRGVRAVATSGQLHRFLTEVLDEAANSGASYRDLTVEVSTGRTR
ncbi:hypothetical protein ACRYCC_11875 [Actinomadura scrupuli]|uniref:hypothetical protein n=1 Tax=Actinomadura scrupuli TaxID=559629 RepID=UPI003D9606A2